MKNTLKTSLLRSPPSPILFSTIVENKEPHSTVGEQLGKSKGLRDTNGMLFQNLAMSILICPQVCLWSKNYNKVGFIVMIHVLHNSTLMCSVSSYLTLCMTYHNVLRFDVSVYNAMTVKKFNCSRFSKKKNNNNINTTVLIAYLTTLV